MRLGQRRQGRYGPFRDACQRALHSCMADKQYYHCYFSKHLTSGSKKCYMFTRLKGEKNTKRLTRFCQTGGQFQAGHRERFTRPETATGFREKMSAYGK